MGIRMDQPKLAMMATAASLALLALGVGRGPSVLQAQPPASASDYSVRVVAYINETTPITREELGEYLIARMGADRLQNLVNRRIIEQAARKVGVEVTAAEIEADLADTIKGLNVNQKEFVSKILKPYNKSLYEWKEDVIRPRLMLTKMCQGRVKISEEDLKTAFEAYHGEKLECQIILWPKTEKNAALTAYARIRDSEAEFERAAKSQYDGKLAATAGKVAAFGRHTTGNEEMEKAAFRLQPGEISQVIETPQGYVVIKCLKLLPPDATKTLEGERATLTKDIVTRKISQQEIPKLFVELSEAAKPKLMLKQATDANLLQEVKYELQADAPKSASK